MDFMKYIQIKREYEERTGEEFPGLGEDRQRKARQKAAEKRVAEQEANYSEEDRCGPPRRWPIKSNRRAPWK